MLSPISGGMLERAMAPHLAVKDANTLDVWQHRVQGDTTSLDQAAGVQSTENYEVLGEHCGWLTMMARAVGILGGASESSSKGLGQAAVVTRADGVHMLSCGGHLCGPI